MPHFEYLEMIEARHTENVPTVSKALCKEMLHGLPKSGGTE